MEACSTSACKKRIPAGELCKRGKRRRMERTCASSLLLNQVVGHVRKRKRTKYTEKETSSKKETGFCVRELFHPFNRESLLTYTRMQGEKSLHE